MEYTDEQIKLWREYEQVRQSGLFNMFDRTAVLEYADEVGLDRLSRLSKIGYGWLMNNYSGLKAAAEKEDNESK